MSIKTQIRGNKQIKDLSIQNDQIASNAGIETSKLAEGAELLKRDGSVALTGDLNANNKKIENLAQPVSDQDAVRKLDLDSAVSALTSEIAAEQLARESADSALDLRLDTAESDINTLELNLAAEQTAREAADTTLQSNINSEASARAAADVALDGRLVKAEENLAFPVDVLFENNSSVYADGRPGVVDPSAALRDGWYFQNSVAGQKINWYFYDGNANNISVADFSMFAVVTVDSLSSLPFLVAYTVGSDNGWFKSSRVFNMPVSGIVTGKKYLIYVGQNPNVHTDIPHIQCVAGTTRGSFASSERILTAALNTNSAASVNGVKLLVSRLGVSSVSYKQELDLRIRHATQVALDSEAAARAAADTTLQNNINSEASARQAADQNLQNQIDALDGGFSSDLSALEARVTTAEGDINTLESGLAQEILDRQAGDASTLSSAQGYTDQKISDLVNGAPAVLDTLKELSDALGGDQNFATTMATQLSSLDSRLDTAESDIVALEGRMDTAEGDINSLEARMSTAEGDISALEAADVAIDGRLDLIEAKDVEQDGRLATLEADLAEATAGAFISREVPVGAIDGVNASFSLSNTPNPGSEQVYLNGILQNVGAMNDYTISGDTITFSFAPEVDSIILVNYISDAIIVGSGGGGGSGATNLNGLSDVNLVAPASSQVLKFNGSQWINGSVSFNDLSDKPVIEEVVLNNFDSVLAPSSGVLSLDVSAGSVVLGDLNASVSEFAFTNVPSGNGKVASVTLIVDGDVAQTYGDACSINGVAVSNGIKWAGGSAPAATNNFDMITFVIVRDNAGTVHVFGSSTTNFS